jgi:hypothetical protein
LMCCTKSWAQSATFRHIERNLSINIIGHRLSIERQKWRYRLIVVDKVAASLKKSAVVGLSMMGSKRYWGSLQIQFPF